jgi:hypothetical protein
MKANDVKSYIISLLTDAMKTVSLLSKQHLRVVQANLIDSGNSSKLYQLGNILTALDQIDTICKDSVDGEFIFVEENIVTSSGYRLVYSQKLVTEVRRAYLQAIEDEIKDVIK